MGRVIAGDATPSVYIDLNLEGTAASGESTNSSILLTFHSSWSSLPLYWSSRNSGILGIYIHVRQILCWWQHP